MKINEDLIRLKEDMLLFINELLIGDYKGLKVELAMVGIFWVFVFMAIVIDLISGYSKAKQRGEARTSYGLKRTVSKFTLYYTCLFLAFMVDAILIFAIASFNAPIPHIPIITMIGSVYLIYVEFRSVMEKAEEKERFRLSKNLMDLVSLLNNKDDIAKALSEIIENNKVNENNTKADR